MGCLLVEGGALAGGSIRISGNKNAVLPILAAALMTDEPVTLHNVPDILDVRSMLEIAEGLGAEFCFERGTVRLSCAGVDKYAISRELCSKNRTSILFAAPLLARLGRAELYPPGGDVIGRRRLDGHIYGLKSLGSTLDYGEKYVFAAPHGLHGRELFLDEASVTATEQILMAAATAEGRTTLYNAACEPHVADLAEFLNAMGAKISGYGGNTVIIDGVPKLHGAEHTIVGDHIEAGSFLALGAACGAELTIEGTSPRHYWMTRRIFERLGVKLVLGANSIYLPGGQDPEVKRDFDGQIPVLSDGTWPQYPSDMMSCTIVAATQVRGTVLFFEKMFESRIYFVDRLIGMGASAIVCDPHRVVINGRSQLHGMSVSSPDIRAGMAMLIAALAAKGKSTIHRSEVIFRGYESLIEKLSGIGARVREEKE